MSDPNQDPKAADCTTPKMFDPLLCDFCGQPGAKTVVDPYDEDVHNTEIERDLCELCYQERRDDI
jgi:hypothetical protein